MVVIYGLKKKLDPIKNRLSKTIHESLMHVLELPENKRAQRFVCLSEGDFFYPEGRSDAYTVIEINMMSGRSRETQKRLIKDLFSRIENKLAISPVDIEITIKEQYPYQWGFRGMTGDEVLDLDYRLDI